MNVVVAGYFLCCAVAPLIAAAVILVCRPSPRSLLLRFSRPGQRMGPVQLTLGLGLAAVLMVISNYLTAQAAWQGSLSIVQTLVVGVWGLLTLMFAALFIWASVQAVRTRRDAHGPAEPVGRLATVIVVAPDVSADDLVALRPTVVCVTAAQDDRRLAREVSDRTEAPLVTLGLHAELGTVEGLAETVTAAARRFPGRRVLLVTGSPFVGELASWIPRARLRRKAPWLVVDADAHGWLRAGELT